MLSQPDLLRLELRSPHRGNVCFVLASGMDVRAHSDTLPCETLTKHEEDLVVLVRCANVTDEATRDAVKTCLQAASRTHDDRLLVMEPGWSTGILVERIKPLMPGDLNLASRIPPTIYFDGFVVGGEHAAQVAA